MGASKETRDGVAPLVAVIESPMVYVHTYELIRQFHAHIARVLERVLHGLRPMVETVLNALGKQITCLLYTSPSPRDRG